MTKYEAHFVSLTKDREMEAGRRRIVLLEAASLNDAFQKALQLSEEDREPGTEVSFAVYEEGRGRFYYGWAIDD